MNPFKTFEKQLKYAFSDNCIKELQNLWSSKTRFYHNADHLISIIENIEKTPSFKELNLYEKNALLYAAFFHDAIYDPKKKDNEDKSIEYFKHSFKPNDIKTVEVVCGLIEVTKFRRRPVEKLKQIFWDADNGMFKLGYDQFLKIEMQIAKEYSFAPKQEYKKGRIEFLKSNLGLFDSYADKNLKKLIEYIEKNY